MERLIKIGEIQPKKSIDVKKSRIGLGFEKLDRDIFDPEKSYPFVANTGVKYARLQSGWQKTERQKGIYDFAWLDRIVDQMIAMGIEPWLCLCYGNSLYTPMAKEVFGAVGCPPIHTEEERTAWARYVAATVEHYKGRIHYYEVWNEPDGQWCWKHGVNARELAEFTNATADVCKATDPDCEVIGFVTCHYKEFDYQKTLCECGVLEHVDAISYHAYTPDDQSFSDIYKLYDELRKEYNPAIKIIQGESGTQSRSDGMGALRGCAWTELKQAKYLLRHLITDLAMGVEFTSYFSCMDMAEALNGTVGDLASVSDFGYFGVVGAEFDENARATGNYYAKPSYYALQHLCSLLCEDYASAPLPLSGERLESSRLRDLDFDFAQASSYAFKRENGAYAVAYWIPRNILTETIETTVSLRLSDELRGKEIRLYDLLNGGIYHLSNGMTEQDGLLKNIPISDSPLLLTFGDWEV